MDCIGPTDSTPPHTHTLTSRLARSDWIQPTRHFESPESKRRLQNLLDVSGLLDQCVPVSVSVSVTTGLPSSSDNPPTYPPHPAPRRLVRVPPRLCTEEELTRFHTPEYVRKIERLSKESGGEAGDFAHFSKVGKSVQVGGREGFARIDGPT